MALEQKWEDPMVSEFIIILLRVPKVTPGYAIVERRLPPYALVALRLMRSH